MGLRLEHQVEQLEAGAEPDDHLDPARSARSRARYLKEAFRAVASVQKRDRGRPAASVSDDARCPSADN